MGNLVIVAIPAEDDLVWKISSEKVPHLTLLYLGETDDDDEGGDTPDSQRMAEFVEHALNISEHGPFYLDVDYRDTLGPDNADVLFFANGWDSRWIKQLRSQLLQQDDIREAYDTANQFPEWQPHLTLGYPTAPAKPVPDDQKIYSVHFDKIAVWNGNFDGPEFRLKWPERYSDDMALAYSDIGKRFVLSHTSVLDSPDVRAQIKAKIQDILDDVDGDSDGDVALFGDPLIRAKLQSVVEDFYKDPNVDKAVVYDALGEAFLQHYGVLGMRWGIRRAKADLSEGGKVSRLRQEGDKLHNQAKTAHPSKAAELRAKGDEKHKKANALEKKAQDYLKGPDAVTPHATSRVPHGDKRKTKIETEGGQNHPAHEDALHVARAQAKLKKSGLSALSNKELNDVANRVQLEERVSLLTASRGRKFIQRHLTNQGNALARAGLQEGVRSAPSIGRKIRRGAATAATVAVL